MKKLKTGHKLLALFTLSLCACLCGNLYGQSYQSQANRLYKDLEQAESLKQPRTIIARAKTLKALALKQHHALDALLAIIYQADAEYSINPDTRYHIYASLDTLIRQSWLSSPDKSLIAAYAYNATYDDRWGEHRSYRWLYKKSDEINSTTIDHEWSEAQWNSKRLSLRQQALSNLQSLSLPIAPRYAKKLKRDKSPWTSTRASLIFPMLHRGSTDKDQVSQTLDRYIASLPLGNELMHASWFRIEQMTDKTAETYREFVRTYAALPEMMHYLEAALGGFVRYEINPKEGIEIVEQFLSKFSPQAMPQIRERLISFREMLLVPAFNYSGQSEYIVGHRKQKIVVHTQHIDSYTVRLYKAKHATQRGRYGNKRDLELISETPYQVPEEPQWGERFDTISLEHPTTGLYYVSIQPHYASRAIIPDMLTKGREDNLSYMPYHVTNLYVINRESEQQRQSQWLDAKTGRPMTMFPLRVYTDNEHFSHRSTDEQGLIVLNSGEDKEYFLRSHDEQDPVGVKVSQSRFDRYYRREASDRTRPASTMITTDRGIYRPGDTVKVYGYLIDEYKHVEEARVLQNKSITLIVSDPNREEIGKVNLQTDGYGRYTHQFSLPKDRMLGQYQITVLLSKNTVLNEVGNPIDAHHIRVEEYKQPSFAIEMTPPQQRYHIGDTLRLPVKVKDFSGATISQAKVNTEIEIRRYTSNNDYRYAPNVAKTTTLSPLTTDDKGQVYLPLYLEALPLPNPIDQSRSPRVNYQEYTVRVLATSPTGESAEQSLTLTLSLGQPHTLHTSIPKYIERNQSKCEVKLEIYGLDRKPYNAITRCQIKRQDKVVHQGEYATNEAHDLSHILRSLASGQYKLYAEVTLPQGAVLRDTTDLVLYSHRDRKIDIGSEPLVALVPNEGYTASTPPVIYFASGLSDSYIFYDVVIDGKTTSRGMLRPSRHALERLPIRLTAAQTEQVFVRLYTVRDAQLYEREINLHRVQPNKELSLRWTTFRDRIRAGSEETWALQVLHQGKPTKASLCALMYDSALDAIAPLSVSLPHLAPYPMIVMNEIETMTKDASLTETHDGRDYLWSLDLVEFADEDGVEQRSSGYESFHSFSMLSSSPRNHKYLDEIPITTGYNPFKKGQESEEMAAEDSQPLVRSNFAHTAFFLPKMETNEQGEVRWTFQLPESLTRWRLDLFAHTQDADMGHHQTYIESFRELMVKPFLPRFVRSTDDWSLATLVSNQTDRVQSGTVKFEIFVPATAKVLHREEVPFSLTSKASTTLRTRLKAIDGVDSLGVRITAITEDFSDGEQHLVPVVKDVQSTIRSEAFTILDTHEHRLSLQDLFPASGFVPDMGTLHLSMESNPLLLALSSLPTLIDSDGQSATDLATRLYVESFIHKVAEIEGLDEWIDSRIKYLSAEGKGERDSLLLQGIQTTPWSQALKQEHEIDRLRLLKSLLHQSKSSQAISPTLVNNLAERQGADGLWSWYPGMRGNIYTTMYIMRLLVRQRYYYPSPKITRAMEVMLDRGWEGLNKVIHQEMLREQRVYTRQKLDDIPIPASALNYLYLQALDKSQRKGQTSEAQSYFIKRLQQTAFKEPLYNLAKTAIALEGVNCSLSMQLIESLRQHLSSNDVGVFFAQINSHNYWWMNRAYTMTTEAIEAFRMLAPHESKTTTALQQWLLNQKRATRWESTIATTEALHALLLGTNKDSFAPLNRSTLVLQRADASTQELSGATINYTEPFSRDNMPQSISVQISRANQTWGMAMVRYDLPASEQTKFGKELRAERTYFIKKQEDGQTTLHPINNESQLRVGDILVTRLHIQLDRDMDFVALYDPRLGFTEPIVQQSGYLWGANTGYYYEPKDRTTNFYFDYLNRGEYILDYEQYVVRSGRFSSPSARLQSVYAPEYSADSGFGGFLEVVE